MCLKLLRYISLCITLLYPELYDLKRQNLPPLPQHTMVSGDGMKDMKDMKKKRKKISPTIKGRNGRAIAVTVLGTCCQVPPDLGAGHVL